MKKEFAKLTIAQFAKLHNVNKRTLHYYDSIGLFCPYVKEVNGYRYYDISQSMNFEYIRMLKELNMSIEEIQTYQKRPSSALFLEIANKKEQEIDNEIQKLKHIKKFLNTKKQQISFCENLKDQEIRIETCKEEVLSILPYDFAEDNVSLLMSYIKEQWSLSQIRMGIGSFISLDKVIHKKFDKYDGIYTPMLKNSKSKNDFIKPKGEYLCGYQRGRWDKIPVLYENMFAYAKYYHLNLTGYAYEIGLNEFAISSEDEYITKIMIKIQN